MLAHYGAATGRKRLLAEDLVSDFAQIGLGTVVVQATNHIVQIALMQYHDAGMTQRGFVDPGVKRIVADLIYGGVELFGAKAGLGNIITTASSVFDMPTLFVAVVTLALAGVILTGILRSFELRLAAWRDVA